MEEVRTETVVTKPAGPGVAVAVVIALFAGSVCAEPYVYPNKGQSADKQENDKMACYKWAKGQTGFDPMQSQPSQQGRVVRGAAGGAAAGAAIGAIAGNAGKGAAIGAASGGIVSGSRKRRSEKAAEGARSEYDRAWGACMEGKGYTVK